MEVPMLQSKLRTVEHIFEDFFSQEGFSKVLAQPIVPVNDDSLYFTNSTIVNFKPMINSNAVPSSGAYNTQHCLRLRNMAHLLEEDSKPYISLFKMLGTIVPASGFNPLLEKGLGLFQHGYGIPLSNVCLKLSSDDREMAEKLSHVPVQKEIDKEDSSFYQWKFGMPKIDGRGVTFSLKTRDGSFSDVGQIIQIREEGKPVAYEFAFGREALLKRVEGVSPFYKCWPIYPIIGDRYGSDSWKVMDIVSTLASIYTTDAKPDHSKRGMVIKKILNNAASLALTHQISDETFLAYIKDFASQELQQNVDTNRLLQDLSTSKKIILINMNKLNHFCEQKKQRIDSGELSFDTAMKQCFNMAEGAYFVPDPQKRIVLLQHFPKEKTMPFILQLKEQNRSK